MDPNTFYDEVENPQLLLNHKQEYQFDLIQNENYKLQQPQQRELNYMQQYIKMDSQSNHHSMYQPELEQQQQYDENSFQNVSNGLMQSMQNRINCRLPNQADSFQQYNNYYHSKQQNFNHSNSQYNNYSNNNINITHSDVNKADPNSNPIAYPPENEEEMVPDPFACDEKLGCMWSSPLQEHINLNNQQLNPYAASSTIQKQTKPSSYQKQIANLKTQTQKMQQCQSHSQGQQFNVYDVSDFKIGSNNMQYVNQNLFSQQQQAPYNYNQNQYSPLQRSQKGEDSFQQQLNIEILPQTNQNNIIQTKIRKTLDKQDSKKVSQHKQQQLNSQKESLAKSIASQPLQQNQIYSQSILQHQTGKSIDYINIQCTPNPKTHQFELMNYSNYLNSISKNDPFGDDEENEKDKRCAKGLRALSLKVKDIVCQKGQTSYKEVADLLIESYNMKDSVQKEEQNIKRRVYDALNVLISADILNRKGKFVYSNDNSGKIGNNLKKRIHKQKSELETLVKELQYQRKEKIQILTELTYKYLALRNLIQRNKQLVSDPSFREQTHEDQIISFPFILFSISNDDIVKLDISKDRRVMSIKSKKQLNIAGDVDVLLKMKFHLNVAPESIKYWVPEHVREFLMLENQRKRVNTGNHASTNKLY